MSTTVSTDTGKKTYVRRKKKDEHIIVKKRINEIKKIQENSGGL